MKNFNKNVIINVRIIKYKFVINVNQNINKNNGNE